MDLRYLATMAGAGVDRAATAEEGAADLATGSDRPATPISRSDLRSAAGSSIQWMDKTIKTT